MTLRRIACLSCGSTSFHRDEHNHLVCDHCGSVFRTLENVCSACNAVNPADALHCNQCGQRLKRRCSFCQHENPPDAEYCANCDNSLDVLEFISRRFREEGAQDRDVLVRTKRADAEFVAEQSARLREIDRQRLDALAVQKAEQVRQQRIMFLVVVGAVVAALFVCGLILLLVIPPGG